jgi:hypothetical protein
MYQLVGHVSLEDCETVGASLDEDGHLALESHHQESQVKKEVAANPGQDKVHPGWIRVL